MGSMASDVVIRHHPDPILSEVAVDVEDQDEAIEIDALLRSVWSPITAGLAAPQLGVSKRVIALRLGEAIWTLLSPRITVEFTTMETGTERCLSVVDHVGRMIPVPVERFSRVTLRAPWALDPQGRGVEDPTWGLTGFEARLAQHEVDHLDGRTLVDHLPTLSRQVRRDIQRRLPS